MPPATGTSHDTLGARLIAGTARVGLAQALLPVTGLVTAAVLTRYLGPDGYGVFTLAASLVVWFEFAIAALLGSATVHWVAKAEQQTDAIRSILRLHLWLSAATAALFWLCAPALAALWNEPEMTPILRLFALDIPIYCMARGYSSILAGRQHFSQQALALAGRWIARLVLTVALVMLGFSIWGAVWAALGASVVELVVASRRGAVPALWRAPATVPGLWAFAGPIFVSVMGIRVLNLDLMLLKALGGSASEAGFYGAAQNLALVPILIAGAASSTLLAALSQGFHGDEREQARHLMSVTVRILLAGFPVAAVISGSAGAVVALIYGPNFEAAGELFALLIFASAGLVAVNASHASVIALGRPRLTLPPVALVVPAAVLGYLILVPRLGPVGAATVTTLAGVATGLLSLGVALYAWRIRFPFLSCLRGVALTGLLYALSHHWAVSGLWVIGKLGILGLAVPVGFALLGELAPRDRRALGALLRRRAPTPTNASAS